MFVHTNRKKLSLGPHTIKTIGPDIVGRKAVSCFNTINGIKEIINDPCVNKHLEYQGKIDPYFVAMPTGDVIDAVKYSVEMGGDSGQ